jgi:hypothetical protein
MDATTSKIPSEWLADLEAASRRSIGSKAAANGVKDRESLPRWRAFRDYWVMRRGSP